MENYNRKLRVFFSFHHRLNQGHYEKLKRVVESLGHVNISVHAGNLIENEESKTSEQIRKEIRDKHLRNVNVTVVIVGSDSRNRKHIDWEIRSTLYKFKDSREGGIVVINALEGPYIHIQELFHKNSITSAGVVSDLNRKFSFLPERLENSITGNFSHEVRSSIDSKCANFPIISYKEALNRETMQKALANAYELISYNRGRWDLETKMRRKNNESFNRTYFSQVNP